MVGYRVWGVGCMGGEVWEGAGPQVIGLGKRHPS